MLSIKLMVMRRKDCTVLCKHTSVSCRDTAVAAISQAVETIQGLGFKCQGCSCDPGESEALGCGHF